MSVNTTSTRRRSASGQRASGTGRRLVTCPAALAFHLTSTAPAREPLSRDTTKVHARQRAGTGGWRLAATLDASSAAEPVSAGRGWLPRWLTAEHPLPWLLPMTAMLLALRRLPAALQRLAELPGAQPAHPPVRVRRPQAVGDGARRRADVALARRDLHLHAGRARRAARARHGDRAAARHRPARLRRPARADDPAAGGPAGGHRHDVPADAGRPVRRARPTTSSSSA